MAKTSKRPEVHQTKIVIGHKSERILQHKSFANDESVDFIRLRFANVVFPHNRSLNGIKNTHFVILGNKVSNKVVAVVCRLHKTNDEAVLLKGIEFGPSLSFVNMNGSMSISPSEDRAEAKWLSLAMSMPT